MTTEKKICIPIFNCTLYIVIYDKPEEVNNAIPKFFNVKTDGSFYGVTFNNGDGNILVAIQSNQPSTIVHEAVHVKNIIFERIGYRSQSDNDEVDAYLVTFLYEKIKCLFDKHNK